VFSGITFRHSLTLRLLTWYCLVLVLLFSVIFTFIFLQAASSIYKRSVDELRDEVEELVILHRSEGQDALQQEFARQVHALGVNNIYHSVMEPNGVILFSSSRYQWDAIQSDSGLIQQADSQRQIAIRRIQVHGISDDVLVAYARLAPGKILRVATVLHNESRFLNSLLGAFIATALIILTAVIIVGWILLHRAVSRMMKVTKTAISISGTSLSRRVPLGGHNDEIDQLATAFNGMLERIESLVKGLNEVTDDVAHDLKSPLARIRGIAESVVARSSQDTATREACECIVTDCDRLLEMINTSLEIRSIDNGLNSCNFKKIDIREVIQLVCEPFEMAAEDRGIELKVNAGDTTIIKGDFRLLQRAFVNLLDNAIKYTEPGGRISVTVIDKKTEVLVNVTDSGIGIPTASLNRVFERFYRADQSRGVPGLGLGLSLAQSIISAHGGSISVQSQQGVGSTFSVILPCVWPDDSSPHIF
jgi:heavy metal sensor kinase